MEPGARTRLTTVLILSVVFGSGVLLGLAADSSLSAEAPTAAVVVETEDEAGAEDKPDTERRYIYHEVDPNEAQLARIQTIVTEWRARREAFDEESRTRWEQGRREFLIETRNAIKAALSPEQAAEYQRLIDEWEAESTDEREN